MQNILETQVTDLESLADSPMVVPAGHEMRGQSLPTSIAEGSAHTDGKRKVDEAQNGIRAPRAKRNRYISIACNECKRRKIKCNGNSPCQRCGHLNLECQYAPNCCSNGFKDSEEFKQMDMRISALQEAIDHLYSSLNLLRGGDSLGLAQQLSAERSTPRSRHSANGSSPPAGIRPPYKQPHFQGPTSSAFDLDVEKNTLQNVAYSGVSDSGDGLHSQEPPLDSPRSRTQHLPLSWSDPLWSVSRDEALRLCNVYHEEMGLMYPFINIESIIRQATNLFRFLEAASRMAIASETHTSNEGIVDADLSILKMVLANALVVESGEQNELGRRLFESVKGYSSSLIQRSNINIKSLPLLTLVALYHFHCDEEALAWRVIGQVARMCIELGINRNVTLIRITPGEEERASAIRLFWTIFILDRRWSFGTGMPFVIQDSNIDPLLPQPEVEYPYLNVMVAYVRIGSRVWKPIAGLGPVTSTEVKKEDINYLDYQVMQWQETIPLELTLSSINASQTTSRAIHRLQILLHLRSNQIRISIYKPVLHNANSIMENLPFAQTVVSLAKDTIRTLTRLNQSTNIYHVQQVYLVYFLVSALAVLFLASCHVPIQFGVPCRDEFYMALDLVKSFSSKSYISKRLWKAVRGFKGMGLRLNSSEGAGDSRAEDPHSTAALAIAGLAGHEIPAVRNFIEGAQVRGDGDVGSGPMNGAEVIHEMTSFFEAALGRANAMRSNTGGYVGPSLVGSLPGDGLGVDVGLNAAGAFNDEVMLYWQMHDLF